MAWNARRVLFISALFTLGSLLWGCSPTWYVVKSMDPILEDMNRSINRNSDVELVRDALPASLVQLDGLIEASPNTGLLLRASEGYFGYTFAFVEDHDKQRASNLYLKARDYSLRILMQNDSFRRTVNKPVHEFSPSLEGFDEDDVPALYWTSNTWLAWISLNLDNPEVLMDVPKVEAMLLKVIELDENYYYGSAHATLGAFYAAQPKTLGGNPEKAQQHFTKAFEISKGRLLFIHLLYAQFYAYQIQDRDLFVQTLEDVIDTPVNAFPERNFANEVAKRKARILLEAVDEYF
ncbi:MAG: TRAP transporter TatT component family protein [Desulfomonilia bacterium]